MVKLRVKRGTYRTADGTRMERGDTFEVSEERFKRLNPESYEVLSETDEESNAEPDADADVAQESGLEPEADTDTDADAESESESESDGAEIEIDFPEESGSPDLVEESAAAVDDTDVEFDTEAPEDREPASDDGSNPLVDHPSVTDEAEAESADTSDAEADSESPSFDDVTPSGHVPDDYQMLSKMAKHYDGDEVHGSMSGDDLSAFFGEMSDTEIDYLRESAESELAN